MQIQLMMHWERGARDFTSRNIPPLKTASLNHEQFSLKNELLVVLRTTKYLY